MVSKFCNVDHWNERELKDQLMDGYRKKWKLDDHIQDQMNLRVTG